MQQNDIIDSAKSGFEKLGPWNLYSRAEPESFIRTCKNGGPYDGQTICSGLHHRVNQTNGDVALWLTSYSI